MRSFSHGEIEDMVVKIDDQREEIRTLKIVLRDLVAAVDAQDDIDPSVALVDAMRDAKSWLKE